MNHSSLLLSDWPSLLSALPSNLDLTALARSKKAIVRSRRVADGETLLRLALWYGPCGMSLRSASAFSTGTEAAVLSDVALFKRLAGAGDWLEAVAAALLAEKLSDEIGPPRPIVIVDGTSIGAPGGNGSDWILHGRCDPETGFNGFELTDQHGGETLTRHAFRAGDIVLADRGYAHIKGLRHVLDQGADFIVRTGWKKLALRDEEGGKFDPLARFQDLQPGQTVDVAITIATPDGPLPVRLVVFAKDEIAVQAEVRRVNRKAAKNQCPVNPRSQMAARYMMIVTSLDPQTYPAEKILALYRRRWQIEIAFKRLKSLIHINRLPAKNKSLARTWLYAHLVFALLIDKLAQHMLDSPPCEEDPGNPPEITMADLSDDYPRRHDGAP
jgi:hypothetical protein